MLPLLVKGHYTVCSTQRNKRQTSGMTDIEKLKIVFQAPKVDYICLLHKMLSRASFPHIYIL